MGVDKYATDIWNFGRPRPDLTLEETMQWAKDHPDAPCADQAALDAYAEERARVLGPAVLAMMAEKRAAGEV